MKYIIKVVFAAIVIIIVASAASAQETPTPSEIIDTQPACMDLGNGRVDDGFVYKFEGRDDYALSNSSTDSISWRLGG